ncbi:MAG: Hsp33 family molecular chaperone HslO [Kiritimatiellae bacterium]|nr:Hsp33 family molecular chaperone HslO [Kiritimatiellia bacterium]
MTDERIQALDPATKLSVVLCDCTAAAGALARGHLSGPTASYYLAEALAGVALLGAETSQDEETVTFRLDCPGPLGGFLVEATAAGTLRGYTKQKILNDFDGLGAPKDAKVLGETGTFEIIRSIPGAILASGAVAVGAPRRGDRSETFVAQGLDAFFAQSLQRRVRTAVAAAAGDDGVPVYARGALVECPPDGDAAAFEAVAETFASGVVQKALASGTVSARTLLKKLGLPHAEVRSTTPLSFACRCSAERAEAMLAAIPEAERAALPPQLDVTCHMCGRTWTVSTRRTEKGA